jgi:hypothetical protein
MQRRKAAYVSGQRKFASQKLVLVKFWKPVANETDSPFLTINLSAITMR